VVAVRDGDFAVRRVADEQQRPRASRLLRYLAVALDVGVADSEEREAGGAEESFALNVETRAPRSFCTSVSP